jgi:limonene-1,2-epoxide hydrolase
MNAHLALVHRLIDSYRGRRFDELIDCFTEDVEYHYHMGTRPVNGKAKMRKFLDNYSNAYEQRAWRIDAWADNGDLLLVEGYEELYDPKYDRIIQQPFMQAYEFRGDRIAKMRDYYDSANHQPPKTA